MVTNPFAKPHVSDYALGSSFGGSVAAGFREGISASHTCSYMWRLASPIARTRCTHCHEIKPRWEETWGVLRKKGASSWCVCEIGARKSCSKCAGTVRHVAARLPARALHRKCISILQARSSALGTLGLRRGQQSHMYLAFGELPAGSAWRGVLVPMSVSASATPPLRCSSGHRVSGSEQLHEFREGGGEAALSPFEVGLIGHGLAEHSDDQRRDEIDGFF